MKRTSKYYRPSLEQYQMVNERGEVKLFVLSFTEFRLLTKPYAVRYAEGHDWQLHPSELITTEHFRTIRTAKGGHSRI